MNCVDQHFSSVAVREVGVGQLLQLGADPTEARLRTVPGLTWPLVVIGAVLGRASQTQVPWTIALGRIRACGAGRAGWIWKTPPSAERSRAPKPPRSRKQPRASPRFA